jgi:hypothetical protein
MVDLGGSSKGMAATGLAVSNSPFPSHDGMTAIRFVLLPKPAAYKQPLRVFVRGLCAKGGDIGLRLDMVDKGRAKSLDASFSGPR